MLWAQGLAWQMGMGNWICLALISRLSLKKGFKVTTGETFGLSQRGGPVMSHIRLSRTRNFGPLIPPNM
ncbi:MAG: 2-oxoacid:acceptor oxidoreductase family protein, partial [Deltaproteobacteria bacterium]|nr:2-oxoacid:acceptor oxidoreductase family protein [Deltaproteobacteria bacterium]